MVGAALVIPQGLLAARKDDTGKASEQFSADAEARARIEQAAMDAVMAAEQALGNSPEDVSKENLGWDITSRTPSHDLRFIEVKGRAAGAKTVTVTRNEILTGFNKPDQWMLALVEVGEDGRAAEPAYVRRPFESEPGGCSVNYNWQDLAAAGSTPS